MTLFFMSMTWADVGRPPECPKGTTRQYLQGYHCVPKGHTLKLVDGQVTTVKLETATLKTQTETKTETTAKKSVDTQNTGCASVYTSRFAFSSLVMGLFVLGRRRHTAQG